MVTATQRGAVTASRGGTVISRLGNARKIAEIEGIVLQPLDAGSTVRHWRAGEVHCVRERHTFSGQDYAFAIDVLQVTRDAAQGKGRWNVIITSEFWRGGAVDADLRVVKWLKLTEGMSADVLAWLKARRESSANEVPSRVQERS